MNIVFLSEQNFIGKVDDDFKNMRTEYAWINMLDAVHLPYSVALDEKNPSYSLVQSAELIILIPGKNHPELLKVGLLLNKQGYRLGIMQEGPADYWHEWPMDYQIIYLALLKNIVKVVFCHNQYDRKYFVGITHKPVIVLPTVNNIDRWKDYRISPAKKEEIVMLGGTACRWYGGMNSYLVANEPSIEKIWVPSMGRMKQNEPEKMKALDSRVEYMPYMEWEEFMNQLSQVKYAVHLMPEVAAASFSLNCAMVGVPCIGNEKCDTQRQIFPDLSIDVHDMVKAKLLMNRLITDKKFYDSVREKALQNVNKFSTESYRVKILEDIERCLV